MALLHGFDVPQELIDTIISHLSEDREALKACSLICSAFAEPSQRGLFARLTFKLLGKTKQDTEGAVSDAHLRRIEALSTSPTVLRCVDVLHLSIHRRCAFDLQILIRFFDGLTHLRELTFSYNSTPDDELIRHICRPTITHLNIEDCRQFPSYHLRQCQSLETLTLSHTKLSTFIPETQDLALPRPHLKELSLIFSPQNAEFISWIKDAKCPIYLHNLKKLMVKTFSILSFQPVVSLLHILSSSLESLDIVPSFECVSSISHSEVLTLHHVLEEWDKPAVLPHFDGLSRLTHLKLRIAESSDFTAFPWVVRQLNVLPPTNVVQELWVKLTMPFPYEVTSGGVASRWKMLDDILSVQRALKRLRTVKIELHHKLEWPESDLEVLIRQVGVWMAGAKEQKLLDILISKCTCFL